MLCTRDNHLFEAVLHDHQTGVSCSVQEPASKISPQSSVDKYIGFSRKDVYRIESQEFTEVYSIHFYHFSWHGSFRYGNSSFIFLLFGTDYVFLYEYFIYFRHREVNVILQTKKLLNLLYTTIMLSFTCLPNLSFDYRISFSIHSRFSFHGCPYVQFQSTAS